MVKKEYKKIKNKYGNIFTEWLKKYGITYKTIKNSDMDKFIREMEYMKETGQIKKEDIDKKKQIKKPRKKNDNKERYKIIRQIREKGLEIKYIKLLSRSLEELKTIRDNLKDIREKPEGENIHKYNMYILEKLIRISRDYISNYEITKEGIKDHFKIYDYLNVYASLIKNRYRYDVTSHTYIGLPDNMQEEFKKIIENNIKHLKYIYERYIWSNYIENNNPLVIEYKKNKNDLVYSYYTLSENKKTFYKDIMNNLLHIDIINIYNLSSDIDETDIEDQFNNMDDYDDDDIEIDENEDINSIIDKHKNYIAINDYNTIRNTYKLITDYDRKKVRKNKRYNDKNGAYSKAYNTYDIIDLTRYQIFNKNVYNEIFKMAKLEDIQNKLNEFVIYDQCLIYALKLWLDKPENIIIKKLYENNEYDILKSMKNFTDLKTLKYIGKVLKIQIKIKYIVNNGKKQRTYNTRHINKGREYPILKLGCVDEHYFINETTPYNQIVIKKYYEAITIKKYNKDIITSNKYNKYKKGLFYNDKSRDIKNFKSYDLIKWLYENDYMKQKPLYLRNLEHQDNKDEPIILNNNMLNINQQEIIKKQPKNNNKTSLIISADFESIQDNNKQHQADLFSFSYKDLDNNEIKTIVIDLDKDNKLNIYELFDKLISGSRKDIYNIYFHNLKYDYSFFKHWKYTNILKRKGVIFQLTYLYKDCRFNIRDSLKLCNQSLDKFTKNFSGTINTKTYFPYSLYSYLYNNHKNLLNTKYNKLSNDDLNIIINYGDNLNFDKFNKFINDMKLKNDSLYSLRVKYIKNDTYILLLALYGFYDSVDNMLKIINKYVDMPLNIDDVYNKLTISGISGLVINHLFSDCNIMNVKGELLDYMHNHIKGGITWNKSKSINFNNDYLNSKPNNNNNNYNINNYINTNKLPNKLDNKLPNNNVVNHYKNKIFYSDINSSYPAALIELLKLGKIRQGKYKIIKSYNIKINNNNKNKMLNYLLNDVTGFYTITNIKIDPNFKNNKFGLWAVKDNKNVLQYKNSIPYNSIYYTDCLELYRLIKFGGLISYKIIGGFDNHNKQPIHFNKYIDLITDLYNQRKQGIFSKSLNEMIKLFLNSIYGYSIIGRHNEHIESFKEIDFLAWFNNNKYNIKNITYYSSKNWYEVTTSQYDPSFSNFSFLGTLILSASKNNIYTMNNYLFNNNCNAVYADTDSLRYISSHTPTFKHSKNIGDWSSDLTDDNYGICDISISKKVYCITYNILNNIKIGNYKFDINKHNDILNSSYLYYKMSFKGFKVKDSGCEISGYLFDNYNKYYDISRGIYRFDWLYLDIYNHGLTIDIAKYNNMKLTFNYDGVKSLAQYTQIFKF